MPPFYFQSASPARARGQMALDLLLAMIILLVALNAFNPIVSQFEKTNAQIGLGQQLRDNARLSSLFISQSMNQFRTQSNYPATQSIPLGTGLPVKWANYVHFTGQIPLPFVRGLRTPQGFDCTANLIYDDAKLTLTIPKVDAGTDEDVSGTGFFTYDSQHDYSIALDGCFSPLVIKEDS